MPLFKSIKRFFQRKKNAPVARVIIVGVGILSYQLANAIISARIANITAFIDDEPWNNRTELLGATVRYPSDIAALVQRHHVDVIIELEGELAIASNIWQEVESTAAIRMTCPPTMTLEETLQSLQCQLNGVAPHY